MQAAVADLGRAEVEPIPQRGQHRAGLAGPWILGRTLGKESTHRHHPKSPLGLFPRRSPVRVGLSPVGVLEDNVPVMSPTTMT